jgi:outer membrane protein assembly factor BamE (lipoprotein component of BamABCDE complex)
MDACFAIRLIWGTVLIMTWIPLKTLIVALLFGVALVSCAQYQSEQGVENLWRDLPEGSFQVGTTTQDEIASLLGPPSQVISHNKKSIFYYLREYRKGGGVLLIVYNNLSQTTSYDRAMFIFDEQGVLLHYSISDATKSQ